MADFSRRLRETIAYTGLLQKEVAERAGIKKRALDMYLGAQKSMPPADVAVRLASAIGVTVEYLVTGKSPEYSTPQSAQHSPDMSAVRNRRFRNIIEELPYIPGEVLEPIEDMVKAIAEQERVKEAALREN